MKKMVKVILYENGTYEVNDADPHHVTQMMYGHNGNTGLHFREYYCPKDEWKKYLMKLLSTNDIDKKIRKLQKQKKEMEKLKKEIAKTIIETDIESEDK